MKKNIALYSDEIDLITLFKIISNSKLKILSFTIISFLLGFGYSYQIPKNYLNSLNLNVIDNYELQQITNIKKIINSNQTNQKNETDQTNEINQIILDKFVFELRDYEEFLLILNDTKKIQEDVQKHKIKGKELNLSKYAKLLEIVESKKKNEKGYILNFKWNDTEEAKKYLQDILNLTSKNLKKTIVDELVQTLEFEKKLKYKIDTERLDYLKEQSIIAKELNIVDNQIDNVNLTNNSYFTNDNNIANIAYYLRGHKAIDKEIELIQKRNYKSLELIENEIAIFKDADIKFVDYNIYLMSSKYLKNTKLILLISILLGLIVGLCYVLISQSIESQTALKNK